jgi:RNA polymerase sigma-70 factor (ECF subfamily)
VRADSNAPRDAATGLEEAELVAGLARGDTRVTREFLRRTHGPVYALTGRLTKDPDQRHDWTGDILLRIVAELGRGRFVYRWPGCFWSWFQKRSYFLLLNLYRDHRRQNDRWTTGEIGEDLAARFPGRTGPDGQQMLEDVDARQALETCLSKLPSEDQQRALTQVLFEGMTYEEIATHSGAALNTVRSWIRRGRLAVRKCVAKAYGLGPGETPWT